MSNQSKPSIIADPVECRECLVCQLVCSLRYMNTFNPAKARIRIGKLLQQGTVFKRKISFTNDCNGCGLCVKYCPYGALIGEKRKKQDSKDEFDEFDL
jgi:NAD-dependent dihydropyrimidine dehydrogenase PreA subunit